MGAGPVEETVTAREAAGNGERSMSVRSAWVLVSLAVGIVFASGGGADSGNGIASEAENTVFAAGFFGPA